MCLMLVGFSLLQGVECVSECKLQLLGAAYHRNVLTEQEIVSDLSETNDSNLTHSLIVRTETIKNEVDILCEPPQSLVSVLLYFQSDYAEA